MLSQEDLVLARKQLSDQIEALPDGPQKEQARQQLESMSDEAISKMVEQQQAQQSPPAQQTQQQSQGQAQQQETRSIFRMIVDGSVPSKKVDENKDAVAVVSIRPVSKGHVIVIPKRAAADVRDLPSGALTLAKKLAKKMITKLGAERTEIQTSRAFDEMIVNAIPVYDKRVDVNSPAYEAGEEELQEVYNFLRVVKTPRKKVIKRGRKAGEDSVVKLKRRVP